MREKWPRDHQELEDMLIRGRESVAEDIRARRSITGGREDEDQGDDLWHLCSIHLEVTLYR